MTTPVAPPSRLLRLIAPLTLSVAVACAGGADSDVLARAAGIELDVEEAAAMLAGRQGVVTRETVISKAEVWVDYTLVAMAAAEDSTLANVDVSAMARDQLQQQVVSRLGEAVLRPDTSISEEELRSLFLEELPGGSVRAGQILLSPSASPSIRGHDSLMVLTEELRRRIGEGEDFETLARIHSTDVASREKGGDLGWIPRGQLISDLEEVLFQLEPGAVSQPVETPFGVHLLRVLERRPADYQSRAASYRDLVRRRRIAEAQQAFLEEVAGRHGLTILERAPALFREALEEAGREVPRRLRGSVLARHDLGTFSVDEALRYVRTREPGYRMRLQEGEDDILEETIRTLARIPLLLAEAEGQGIRIQPSEEEAMSQAIREQLIEQVFRFGFVPLQPMSGESRREAVDRVVGVVVEPIFRGSGGVHLRRVTLELEARYGAEILDGNVGKVLSRLNQGGL